MVASPLCAGQKVVRTRPSLAKLTPPRLHSPIARARLFAMLDAAQERQSAVAVVGTTGAGKTTLVHVKDMDCSLHHRTQELMEADGIPRQQATTPEPTSAVSRTPRVGSCCTIRVEKKDRRA